MIEATYLYSSLTMISVRGVIGAYLERENPQMHLYTRHFKSETGRRPFCNSAGTIIWNNLRLSGMWWDPLTFWPH